MSGTFFLKSKKLLGKESRALHAFAIVIFCTEHLVASRAAAYQFCVAALAHGFDHFGISGAVCDFAIVLIDACLGACARRRGIVATCGKHCSYGNSRKKNQFFSYFASREL